MMTILGTWFANGNCQTLMAFMITCLKSTAQLIDWKKRKKMSMRFVSKNMCQFRHLSFIVFHFISYAFTCIFKRVKILMNCVKCTDNRALCTLDFLVGCSNKHFKRGYRVLWLYLCFKQCVRNLVTTNFINIHSLTNLFIHIEFFKFSFLHFN